MMMYSIYRNGILVGRLHFKSQEKADNYCRYYAYKAYGPGYYTAERL